MAATSPGKAQRLVIDEAAAFKLYIPAIQPMRWLWCQMGRLRAKREGRFEADPPVAFQAVNLQAAGMARSPVMFRP